MLADLIPKVAEAEMLARGDTGFGKYSPRPSSAGPERCIRQMVFHAMGMPPKPLPGRSLLVFDDSTWHEELTKQWVAKSAHKLHSDQMGITLEGVMPWRASMPTKTCRVCSRVYKAVDIHGHLDFMIQDSSGEDFLIEHKAINHFGFNRIWEEEDWPLDYLTQMAIYFKGVIQSNPNVKRGYLLIKNKNTAQYIEYETVFNDAVDTISIVRGTRSDGETFTVDFTLENVFKNAIEKFRLIEDHYLKEKILPKRPYFYSDKEGFPCGYCAWNETCWVGYEKELEARGTNDKLEEVFDDCARYLKLTKIEGDAKKEKEEIKARVRAVMLEKNLKAATTLGHVLSVELRHREASHRDAYDFEQLSIKSKTYGRKEDTKDRRKKTARSLKGLVINPEPEAK